MESPTARSLAVKRLRVHRLVLTATACTVLILSVLLGTIVGLGTRAPGAALRASLITTPVVEVVDAPAARDAAGQDVSMRRIIAATFAGLPMRVVIATPKDATWTISPVASRLTPSELPRLASAYAHLRGNVTRSFPSAQVSGAGRTTLAAIRSALAAAAAVIPIPIGVVSLAGVIALALCGQLLAATRDNETRLLRARGARVRDLVVTDAIEALAVAAPSAVIGGILAQVVLLVWPGAPTGPAEIVLPIVTTIALAGIVGAVGSLVAARGASGAPRQSSGRATGIASAGVTVLVLALAGIATWRFLSYGTPTPGTPEDASALIAPAALLLAAALVGLLLLGPVFGVVERLVGQRPSIAVLSSRQVHRSASLYAGVVASIILTVATAMVASGYSSTWSSYLAESSRLTTGSDVRVAFGGSTLDATPASLLSPGNYANVPNVTAVAPVLRESDSIGDEDVTTIGVPDSQLRAIVGPDSSVLSASTLASELRPKADATSPSPLHLPGAGALSGIALPDHTTSVTLHIETTASAATAPEVSTTLWISDGRGDIAPLGLGQFRASAAGEVERTATLPAGISWTIVAIDSVVQSDQSLASFEYSIADVTAVVRGRAVPVPGAASSNWVAQPEAFGGGPTGSALQGSLGYSMASPAGQPTDSSIRLMPKGSAVVPVVLSRALAEANGFHVGSRIDVTGTWASFQGRVTGIVPLVPGVTSGASLAVDLQSVENGWLRTSEQVPALRELWIASSDPAKTAKAVADVTGRVPHVTLASVAAGREFIANAVLGLWIGAGGGVAFVILALVAAVAVMLRRRSDELGVLRGLGVSAARQAALRRTEFVIVALYAAVAGIVLGLAVALTTVAVLARASTPSAPRDLTIVPRFDLVSIAAVVVILAVAITLILARYGGVLRAAARRALP